MDVVGAGLSLVITYPDNILLCSEAALPIHALIIATFYGSGATLTIHVAKGESEKHDDVRIGRT